MILLIYDFSNGHRFEKSTHQFIKKELGTGFKDGVSFIPMKVVHLVHIQQNTHHVGVGFLLFGPAERVY